MDFDATVLQCFLEIAGTRCRGLRAAAVAAVQPRVTQKTQLLHPTQMQCSADLAPVMC